LELFCKFFISFRTRSGLHAEATGWETMTGRRAILIRRRRVRTEIPRFVIFYLRASLRNALAILLFITSYHPENTCYGNIISGQHDFIAIRIIRGCLIVISISVLIPYLRC
jgi:hypothetical protein